MLTPDQIATGLKNPKKALRFIRNKTREQVNGHHPLYAVDALSLAVTSRYPWGTYVLDREWDVLVILDTCRVDALQEVAPEFDFIEEVESIWSLGGSSPDWIAHTFDERHRLTLQNTAYICSNPHGETVIDDQQMRRDKHSTAARRFYRWGSWNQVRPDEIGKFERLWQYESPKTQDGPELTHVRPRVVTDRTIDVMRSTDFDRVIAHYMPPHYPWISNAIAENREVKLHEQRPNKIPETSKQEVWNAYLDDLRWVLEDIALLLKNIDAETVVLSADHGDAFGEYRMYGHDPGRIHPKIRRVPWVETTATNQQTYEPTTELQEQTTGKTEEQLEALGYK
jgi:hypothetical protein